MDFSLLSPLEFFGSMSSFGAGFLGIPLYYCVWSLFTFLSIIQKHPITCLFVFLFQLMISCQEKLMATLIIFAHDNDHGLLQTFADSFHSPGDLL